MYLKWPETYRTTKGPPESQENPVILTALPLRSLNPHATNRHRQDETPPPAQRRWATGGNAGIYVRVLFALITVGEPDTRFRR